MTNISIQLLVIAFMLLIANCWLSYIGAKLAGILNEMKRK